MKNKQREIDLAMLYQVLNDNRLDDQELNQFAGMKYRLEQSENAFLSGHQRNFLRSKFNQFKLTLDLSVLPKARQEDTISMGPKVLSPPPIRRHF